MQVLIYMFEFVTYADYDLVNNQKAYAKMLSIRKSFFIII